MAYFPSIPSIPSSEITPEHVYENRKKLMDGFSRRKFLAGLGAAAGASTLAACGGVSGGPALPPTRPDGTPVMPVAQAAADELGNSLTSFEAITSYNNFYEFSTRKEAVADLAQGFMTSPWQVEVGGLVANPGTFDIDDLKGQFDIEERIYRLRCVEAWSMVIPWKGFPLSALLSMVEPLAGAQYVRFETVLRPDEMKGQRSGGFDWPYVEGLRLDEAMNDLAILATGLYGEDLLPQSGAPIRLVVPWKYGFKSIKSIVKIDLVEEMPTSLWMDSAPSEYGFFANVNPEVDHPRWSQATERRIEGGLKRRPTLKFNGYEEQVAHLYDDLDLAVWF